MFGRAGGSATRARASACAKEQIRQYIRRINRTHGKTVILTTHDMGDIEKLCDRVVVIDKGRIMYDGGLGELKRRYAADSVIAADVRGKVEGPESGAAESGGRQARGGAGRGGHDHL